MRSRAWAALILAAAGLALAVAGRHLPAARLWNVIAGLMLLVAIALGISLLRFWRDLAAPLQPVTNLFTRPRSSERWCAHCGHPTTRKGPCRTCGHTPTSRGA